MNEMKKPDKFELVRTCIFNCFIFDIGFGIVIAETNNVMRIKKECSHGKMERKP